MLIFEKKISEEENQAISKAFYRYIASQNALDSILKDINSDRNKKVMSIINNTYTEDYANWKISMDKLEYNVLGTLYHSFIYKYDINFPKSTFSLSTEDDDQSEALKAIGFIQL